GGRHERARWALAEEAEELRVRRQHHPRPAFAEGVAVGLHGPPELEEGGVALERLGEDADRLLLALAAQDVGLGLRLGEQHGALAVGVGADAQRLALALGALLAGDALTLRLHAREDRLG